MKWVKEVNDKKFIDQALKLDGPGMIKTAQADQSACSAGGAVAAVAAARPKAPTKPRSSTTTPATTSCPAIPSWATRGSCWKGEEKIVGGGPGPTALPSPHAPLPTRKRKGDPLGRTLLFGSMPTGIGGGGLGEGVRAVGPYPLPQVISPVRLSTAALGPELPGQAHAGFRRAPGPG